MRVVQYFRRPGPGRHSIERLYQDVRAHLPVDIEVYTCVSCHESQGLWRRLSDMVRARANQGDVNHVTGDVNFLTFLLERRRTILTIHDCAPMQRLSGAKRWLWWLFWLWMPERRSTAIVAVSEATRSEILRYLRCDPSKVHVIHNNVSAEFRAEPRPFNRERPRVLHIGTMPNKNLERTAQALQGLGCRLVIIGRLNDSQRVALDRLEIEYENLTELSTKALRDEYVRCDLLVFASTLEGFGLPIIEAQAVGRPVVTSNLLSMPEVAGDAACFVDPFDVASIRSGVRRVIEDEVYRAELIERGFVNVRRFSVEIVAARYAALYRNVHAAASAATAGALRAQK